MASQPVRLMPRPVFVVGREELLADLGARLSPRDGAGTQVVALCGLGGAGKTSVAVEYAHRHLAGLGMAWQLAADEPTALAAAFGDLAAQLGPRDLLTAGDPVAQVHAALAARSGDWLLIFDSAPGPGALQGMLPPAGCGRVLITSQEPHWPGQAVDIPVLDREVAAAFLLTRTASADRSAAIELATELGGLPLALEQACAYMQATGRSIAGYLALFRQRRTDLLARGEIAGYSKQVTTTWALAFDQLQHASPQAIGLLRLLACCAPEQIPLNLLLQPRPDLVASLSQDVARLLLPLLEDSLAADRAVAALRRYSLVSPPAEGSLSVHRLVQAVTIAQLPAAEAEAWREAARFLIGAAMPADTDRPGTWPVCAALLPHVQATHPADSDAMKRVAAFLGFSGNIVAARVLLHQVVDARERALGAEHPDTLRARVNLAYWTGHAGDLAAARDQFAALLPASERVLGAEHPDTLHARANLAYWTGRAEDAAAARDQYAALLPVTARVLGAEHPHTLNARANLAHWTGRAGDLAAARDQYAALLPASERVLGAEHPDTLRARINLARQTGEEGDVAAARDQYAALLPGTERALGAEHPDTVRARINLAHWTGHAGDVAAARDQYAALLPVTERALGAEHSDTLDARANLAHWTGRAEDAAAARDQYAALLPVIERVLGAEHPDTLRARANLAYWTGQADRQAEDR